MSARIVVEEVQKDVIMMTDPDAEFVSLVRHGANRMPFRVVKTAEKGGDTSVIFAVHSILLPTGVKLDTLSAQEGKQWLAEARVDKAQQHDDYQKLVQTEMKDFDPASMQMVSLGDGALAIVGKLQRDVPNALTVGVEVSKALPPAPIDAPMESEAITLAPSFRDVMERELDGMLSVIYGVLKQATGDTKKRKSSILGAVDNFKTFLSTALDSIGAAKVEREVPAKNEGGLEHMFKTKEEFAQAVGEILTPMLKEFGDVLKKELLPTPAPKAEIPPEVPKAETPPDLGEMIATAVGSAMKPFTEKLDALVAKTETIGSQVAVTPAAAGSPEHLAPVTKTDKPSVFAGLLTGKALPRSAMGA